MKKILVVFGTRPEAIKMAPVCIELNKHKDIKLVVCVTAQHREMLDQVLNTFNIFPQIDLDVMKKGQDLFEITSTILLKIFDNLPWPSKIDANTFQNGVQKQDRIISHILSQKECTKIFFTI